VILEQILVRALLMLHLFVTERSLWLHFRTFVLLLVSSHFLFMSEEASQIKLITLEQYYWSPD